MINRKGPITVIGFPKCRTHSNMPRSFFGLLSIFFHWHLAAPQRGNTLPTQCQHHFFQVQFCGWIKLVFEEFSLARVTSGHDWTKSHRRGQFSRRWPELLRKDKWPWTIRTRDVCPQPERSVAVGWLNTAVIYSSTRGWNVEVWPLTGIGLSSRYAERFHLQRIVNSCNLFSVCTGLTA